MKNKGVLLNPKDNVQLSIAHELSKQDSHVHKSTLEIYISDFIMELISKEADSTICEKVIVIIPPCISHRIKFSGMTYVLQVLQNDLAIDSDKEIIKEPALNK